MSCNCMFKGIFVGGISNAFDCVSVVGKTFKVLFVSFGCIGLTCDAYPTFRTIKLFCVLKKMIELFQNIN